MITTQQQTSVPKSDVNRRNVCKRRANTSAVLVLIILWGALVGGGFYIAKEYLDKSINMVQQTNSMSIQTLSDRMDNLAGEIQSLKQLWGNADQTLSTTGSLQMELNQKIEMLIQRQEELERSLNILKEAP